MKLFVVFETGRSGKKAGRAYRERVAAERCVQDKNPHLFKIEEASTPDGYVFPTEMFAAHTFDRDYGIHRFWRFFSDHDEAKREAGENGLVLLLVPE